MSLTLGLANNNCTPNDPGYAGRRASGLSITNRKGKPDLLRRRLLASDAFLELVIEATLRIEIFDSYIASHRMVICSATAWILSARAACYQGGIHLPLHQAVSVRSAVHRSGGIVANPISARLNRLCARMWFSKGRVEPALFMVNFLAMFLLNIIGQMH